MGKHHIDESREPIEIVLRQTSFGQWEEWTRYYDGSGHGQCNPFNKRANALRHAIVGRELYREERTSQYFITIQLCSEKFYRPELATKALIDMAVDGKGRNYVE